jgi:hypothetical protein
MFFNPLLLTLITQLMRPCTISNPNDPEQEISCGSVLMSFTVPPEFVNRAWDDVFDHLLTEHGVIATGVRRPAGYKESLLPYVVTHPRGHAVLQERDEIFVLLPPGEDLADLARD